MQRQISPCTAARDASRDPEREPMPVAGDVERPPPDAWAIGRAAVSPVRQFSFMVSTGHGRGGVSRGGGHVFAPVSHELNPPTPKERCSTA